MKGRENKPHTKRIRTMALSVFLAVIVWIMVMSLTDPSIKTTVSNLDIRFIGEQTLRDNGLAITGRDALPSLSVIAHGNRGDLMENMDDIHVVVDVSSISAEGSYNLAGTIYVPTTRISVEKENYSNIPITVERVVSKEIEVSVKQTGAQRNKLIKSVIDNPRVTLTGARSEIDKIAGATATVDVSGIRDKSVERVGYVLTDISGNLLTGNETMESARTEVEVTSTAYDVKTLPIEAVLSEEMDKQYTLDKSKTTITPSTVTIGIRGVQAPEKIQLIIDRPAENDAQDYVLQAADGIYIPESSRTVKVKPQLEHKNTAEESEKVDADGR